MEAGGTEGLCGEPEYGSGTRAQARYNTEAKNERWKSSPVGRRTRREEGPHTSKRARRSENGANAKIQVTEGALSTHESRP